MNTNDILNLPIHNIIAKNQVYADFFSAFGLKAEEITVSFHEFINTVPNSFWDDHQTNRHAFIGMFIDFSSGLEQCEKHVTIQSLDILAGVDKSKNPEPCSLHLVAGEITCIVGPTGSGKSRLLADIEWLANCDTPTKRKVLINGEAGDSELLEQYGGKLIAQITQNMNFVLDMSVYEFLMLHAQSRFLDNAEQVVQEVILLANELSGEQFETDTPVTFLSGGQSRALMIADVACIGQAPIVLIDEIENAGVNKKKALELLVSKDKIVLMATHDPLLILLADKRVVIKNGGMHKIIETNAIEREFYAELNKLDETLQLTKNFFREGNELTKASQLI